METENRSGLKKEVRGDVLERVSAVEEKMEMNAERRQNLITIMSKGYIEPALFTREDNELAAEAERLEEEKKKIMREAGANTELENSLEELERYVSHTGMMTECDRDAADRFLDHVTVHDRDTVTFRLKCGLALKERIR